MRGTHRLAEASGDTECEESAVWIPPHDYTIEDMLAAQEEGDYAMYSPSYAVEVELVPSVSEIAADALGRGPSCSQKPCSEQRFYDFRELRNLWAGGVQETRCEFRSDVISSSSRIDHEPPAWNRESGGDDRNSTDSQPEPEDSEADLSRLFSQLTQFPQKTPMQNQNRDDDWR